MDRDNEVTRVIWAFKINPYEQLNLRFDAADDEVRRQYRKLSLLVHPDKCSHPQAREAFESASMCEVSHIVSSVVVCFQFWAMHRSIY